MRGVELLLLAACTGVPKAVDTADTGGDTGADTSGDNAPPEDLVLTDANNYSYFGALDGPTVRTAELTDLAIDWAAMALDLQCHDVDPVADIDNVALMAFPNLTEAEVEAGLTAGNLEQVDLGGYVSLAVGDETDATLAALTFFGKDVDIELQYAEGSATWMLLLATGTTVGVGTRSLLFLEPHADESNTSVSFGDSCAILDFTADLSSLAPVPALEAGPWRLDWSALTRDGQGNAIELGNADQLLVGHYADATPDELAARFLDLELLATDLWYWDLPGGTTFDLSAPTSDGGAFPGMSGGGTWILALRCTLCPNPAPLFLTVLTPGTSG